MTTTIDGKATSRELHLFTWVTASGRRCPVKCWNGYGVVCPSEFTTNGNIAYLADCLIGRDIASIEPGLIDPTIAITTGDKVAFVDLVFNAYMAWKEAGYPEQVVQATEVKP